MKVTKSVTFSKHEVDEFKKKAIIEEAAKVLGACDIGKVYEVDELYHEITVSIKDKEIETV